MPDGAVHVEPLVTIAIPTLNRAEYLRLALTSALAQTYRHLEVVVSNNASTDHTEDVLSSFRDPRLRVINQTSTIPMMSNWNACLAAASGTYFLLLSDDDLLELTAVEELVAKYGDCSSEDAFVYCSGLIIDSSGKPLSAGATAPAREDALSLVLGFLDGRRSLWPGAILFRRGDIVSGYSTELPLAADAARWISVLGRYGSARFLNRRLSHYRVHENTTFKTALSTWRNENERLGAFIIAELTLEKQSAEKVRTAVRHLNTRITSELINQTSRGRRLSAITHYCLERRIFSTPYGVLILAKGLFLLSLPSWFKTVVRRYLYSGAL